MQVLNYLQQNYKAKTAQSYYKYWRYFERYLAGQKLPVEAVTHQIIINYINHLQDQKLAPKGINHRLMVLEKVFVNLLKSNPVQGLRLQHKEEKPLPKPISYERLANYLNELPNETKIEQRNWLILSLIHEQALRLSEIKALQINHLKAVSIAVPSVLRSLARTLPLTPLQALRFDNYLKNTRSNFPQNGGSQLFLSVNGSAKLTNTLTSLQRKVKAQLPELQNLAHWRSSVIVYWLEQQPLLEVQRKLGHRYASSTERYKIHSIKTLQEALIKHHPLR